MPLGTRVLLGSPYFIPSIIVDKTYLYYRIQTPLTKFGII